MLPGFLVRMLRRGNYREKFGQRLGFYTKADRQRLAAGGWLWIHAVSVGEMLMGIKLARTLQAGDPGAKILLSTTTSTGYAVARAQIEGSGMELIYYPLDLASIVRRVLDLVRPAQLVMVDKELWPNMVAECFRRGIPLSVVNARLSPKSERGFRRWRRWTGPFFGMLERVCVQEPEDIARWETLGVRPEALVCTGSLKFDFAEGDFPRAREFRALLARVGVPEETPILLAGSTFPGEEAALGRVTRALRERFPDLFLIVVPRHVERTPEAAADLRGAGLQAALRSALPELPPGSPRPDALIVDTTGELRDWYALASVCFVGKSLCAHGGQNPAEPVLAGRPVVFGPNMENFEALVRQFLAVDGAVRVADEAGLLRETGALLADPARGEALVKAARGVLRAHLGANQRTADLLRTPASR
ncbi:MAG: glycosyltransferase N-terminal domain-containing protein [Chthoniobacteraceae bacterium]|nr:glycosyltransferase N-terminal domain-containing protein [Chthoniobacteraceae bacterium]